MGARHVYQCQVLGAGDYVDLHRNERKYRNSNTCFEQPDIITMDEKDSIDNT